VTNIRGTSIAKTVISVAGMMRFASRRAETTG
jgi:hypothetical protein